MLPVRSQGIRTCFGLSCFFSVFRQPRATKDSPSHVPGAFQYLFRESRDLLPVTQSCAPFRIERGYVARKRLRVLVSPPLCVLVCLWLEVALFCPPVAHYRFTHSGSCIYATRPAAKYHIYTRSPRFRGGQGHHLLQHTPGIHWPPARWL